MQNGPQPDLSTPAAAQLRVEITREMWSEYFVLKLENGHTEELEPEETREWFKMRGANMDGIEKVLDHAWNFGVAEAVIAHPKELPVLRLPHSPDI